MAPPLCIELPDLSKHLIHASPHSMTCGELIQVLHVLQPDLEGHLIRISTYLPDGTSCGGDRILSFDKSGCCRRKEEVLVWDMFLCREDQTVDVICF